MRQKLRKKGWWKLDGKSGQWVRRGEQHEADIGRKCIKKFKRAKSRSRVK
jgi:hypothetical protein